MQDRIRSFGEGFSQAHLLDFEGDPPARLPWMAIALMLAILVSSPASAGYIASSTGSIGVGSGSGDNVGNFLLVNQWDPAKSGYALATDRSAVGRQLMVSPCRSSSRVISSWCTPVFRLSATSIISSHIPYTTTSATTILGVWTDPHPGPVLR